MPKKGKSVKFKNFERQIKSSYMIKANFWSILVPENNGRQNPSETYTNQYQKHVACSYGYKLVCTGNKFSKPMKPYLSEDVFDTELYYYHDQSKLCTDMIKKHFNKNLVMT